MGNEFQGLQSHSAERFGDSRDYWWHDDYLGWRAAGWGLERVRSALDVGSGVGHWGRRLASVLPSDARLIGVDRDPLWVQKAAERAAAAGLGARYSYTVGEADQLPFADASFDLVTCQTVLMHLPDPLRALSEMVRVARPGGLVLVAEPTNVVGPVLHSAIALHESPELLAQHIRFQFICQDGKRALGEGDVAIGERLPSMFRQVGLERIDVRMNDRVPALVPPYETVPQRAMLDEIKSDVARERWIWDRRETRRFFEAGGGDLSEFDALFDAVLALRKREVAAFESGTFANAGGPLFYLIWGYKAGESRDDV